jgi:hypothetical protein
MDLSGFLKPRKLLRRDYRGWLTAESLKALIHAIHRPIVVLCVRVVLLVCHFILL